MGRSGKKRSGFPLGLVLLVSAVLVVWTALIAGGVWYLVNESRPAPAARPTPTASPAPDAALFQETRAALSAPFFASRGKLIASSKTPTGSGNRYAIVWQGNSSTDLILAEKAVEGLWSPAPGLKILTEYPDHALSGEKVRLTAELEGRPFLEVSLKIAPAAPAPTSPPGPAKPASPPVPVVRHSGKLAIIIDDVGYDLAALDALLALPAAFTYAVLPNSRHAEEAVKRLRSAKVEVILHMPMEPLDYPGKNPGEGALLLGMTPEEIRKRIDSALAVVPMARGMNNHMGSAFTADPSAMRLVLGIMKEKGLYYIDSKTIRDTTAYDVAREMGVPVAQRNLFLDNDQSPESIRSVILELADLADQQGVAIGIGHPHPQTVAALQELVPGLVKSGLKFIPAGKVAR